jgi:hypothetical protein
MTIFFYTIALLCGDRLHDTDNKRGYDMEYLEQLDIRITFRAWPSDYADVVPLTGKGREAIRAQFTHTNNVLIPKTKAVDLSRFWEQKGLRVN